MKRIKTILFVSIYGFSLTYFIYINRGNNSQDKKIIKSVKDARGLTSVIYRDGKDTFALDYASPTKIDSLICPDCGQAGCIYQEINETVDGDGTDQDILNAIYKVCDKRGITDSTTIDLIKANYYL